MESLLGEKVRAFLIGLAIACEVSWIADALRRRDYAALTVALAVAFVATAMVIAVLISVRVRRHPQLPPAPGQDQLAGIRGSAKR